MKKLMSLMLVLVLVLSLSACGKEATLTDLLECPTSSLDEAEVFLEKAGLEIENTTEQYVTFAFGNWDGRVSATGISLSISQSTARTKSANYDQEVEDMLQQVEDLCGEPYNTSESNNPMGLDMQSNTSFYQCDSGIIVVDETTIAGTSEFRVVIYPGESVD